MTRARGFTLVEILVALVLFGVVGGVLLQLFGEGLRTARLAAEQSHAVLLARSTLTELQNEPALRPGNMEGDLGDGYRWEAALSEAESIPGRAPALVPLDLVLTIHWGEPDEPRSFRLDSLLLTQDETR